MSTRAAPRIAGLAVALSAVAGFGCHGSRGSSATVARAEAAGTAAVTDAAPPRDDAAPPATSDDLAMRARHLLEALGAGDAQLATDIVFPRDGWLNTRDASDPGKDWERHVAAPFRRAVHAIARRHLNRATFVSLEVGQTVTQETPRRHAWKKPLWTVRQSRLTFVVDGRTRTLPIREMTAWRGAWYVTRLR